MDVYFRSCPRDVRVTTLIFIPSLNTKMCFIMLEKGIFLKSFKVLQTRHCFRVWKPNFFQGLDPGADCVNSIGTIEPC